MAVASLAICFFSSDATMTCCFDCQGEILKNKRKLFCSKQQNQENQTHHNNSCQIDYLSFDNATKRLKKSCQALQKQLV